MNLNHVATFLRIVEAGGISAGAEKLNVPKSSLSRSLSALEVELGVPLFQRSGRTLKLNDAGRAFFDAASRGLAAVEEAKDAITAAQAEPKGLVRIAAQSDMGSWIVAPLVAGFLRQHPQVEVELTISSRPVDLLKDGYDLAVHRGTVSDGSLVARKLGQVEHAVFASTAYLEANGRPKKPADLARFQCVLQSGARSERWKLEGLKGDAVVEVSGPVKVADLFAAISFAAGGCGLALLPAHVGRSWPQANALERVLPEWTVRGEVAQVVYAGARHVPRRVAMLADVLVGGLTSECASLGKGKAPRH